MSSENSSPSRIEKPSTSGIIIKSWIEVTGERYRNYLKGEYS